MQLYVGDYLRDTQGLSCEGHGAYLLTLMALWNAGGYLPDDDRILARVARCTPARWRIIGPDVRALLTVDGDRVCQRRLLTELEKAKSKHVTRATSGSSGGKAKALKDKDARLANATILLCHSPEPEPDSKKKKAVEAAPPTAAPPKPKPSIGSRWPSDQEVPTEWMFWARERFGEMGRAPPDLAVEAVKFANYWASKSGRDATKVDWKKTFLNWCLNAKTNEKRVSAHDSLNAGVSRYLERLRSEDGGQGQDSDPPDPPRQLLLAT